MSLFNKYYKLWLFILISIVFINLIFSVSFPVFPDEINWRVLYSRAIDGSNINTYSILYSENNSYTLTYAALPFFFETKKDAKGFSDWANKNKIDVFSSCDFNYIL